MAYRFCSWNFLFSSSMISFIIPKSNSNCFSPIDCFIIWRVYFIISLWMKKNKQTCSLVYSCSHPASFHGPSETFRLWLLIPQWLTWRFFSSKYTVNHSQDDGHLELWIFICTFGYFLKLLCNFRVRTTVSEPVYVK